MASIPGGHGASPGADGVEWSGQEYSSGGSFDNASPSGSKSPSAIGMNFLKGFSGVQKKVTRDGQPAKRRGPKPDSKPAQTRRQELNRQAQRTHRERKEQYIKALESELSRLREGYTNDVANMNSSLEQHRAALKEHMEENALLKEILVSRGIPFEIELQNRRTVASMQPRKSSFGHMAPAPVPGNYNMMAQPRGSFSAVSPPAGGRDRSGADGRGSLSNASASGVSYLSHSPAEPGVSEQAIKQEPRGISDMPGIFEKDPQLGIDFILALEATCRDHNEYLIRRSVESPDDSEETQFSGHALMACCPPPTHISNTPAQQGGLVPTYPHQVPSIPLANLNTLLNLSHQMAAQGHVEGGQVTPVMALQSLRANSRYQSLTRDDVVDMVDSIKNKVRCYGFGAVMEDFELHDALSSIFATKLETYESAFSGEYVAETDDLYS